MRITCWGARGSISVCGPHYVKYGGETTCLEIRGPDDQLVIVDAGTGIRRLGNRLLAQGPVSAELLFTHAHLDHLSGFPFFQPIYQSSTKLAVTCCAFQPDFVEQMINHTMDAPYYPVPLARCQAEITFPEICGGSFTAGGLTVDTIPLSHPNGGVGYRFIDRGRTFVFLTDNELGYDHPNGVARERYVEFCRGADLLIHDAEYTEEEYQRFARGYGHSTYNDALALAMEAGVKEFGLFHHNQDRSDEEVDRLVADCRRLAAEAGSDMEITGVAVDQEFEV